MIIGLDDERSIIGIEIANLGMKFPLDGSREVDQSSLEESPGVRQVFHNGLNGEIVIGSAHMLGPGLMAVELFIELK